MANMNSLLFMKVNFDSLFMMLKFTGIMILLLLLVFFLAKWTPLLAKLFDKILKKEPNPERVEVNSAEKHGEVRGIYDAQISEDIQNNDDNINGDVENGKQ